MVGQAARDGGAGHSGPTPQHQLVSSETRLGFSPVSGWPGSRLRFPSQAVTIHAQVGNVIELLVAGVQRRLLVHRVGGGSVYSRDWRGSIRVLPSARKVHGEPLVEVLLPDALGVRALVLVLILLHERLRRNLFQVRYIPGLKNRVGLNFIGPLREQMSPQ